MEEDIIVDKSKIKRVKTYIEGLDEKMEGGIPVGHITLISGSAGTMKSSLAFNLIYNEAKAGRKSLYLSLEQSYSSLIQHMVNLGFDIKAVNLLIIKDIADLSSSIKTVKKEEGLIILLDIGAIRKQVAKLKMAQTGDWLNVVKNSVKKIKESVDNDYLVLDSLSALLALSNFESPRRELFQVFEFLRDLHLTSFIIAEVFATDTRYSEYAVEDYLSDGILHLQLTERQRKVIRELSIVKMRATSCSNDVHTLEFKNGRFRVMHGGQPPLL